MDTFEIEGICGPTPVDFIEPNITGSDYIFQNDPLFDPLNVYDFFGRGATVNSFSECFYYVNLGFSPDKVTIFDYLLPTIFTLAIGLCGFLLYKWNFKTKLIDLFSTIKKIDFKKYKNNRITPKILFSIFLIWSLIQYYFLFRYVSSKALRIPSFIDEYNVISSSYLFFTQLDFNAGGYLGGNYTVQLTSGPLSALGGVIGWSLTESFNFSRVSNFIWLFLLQFTLAFFIGKNFNLDKKFLFLTSGLFLILIPWWQGGLYSLGEIPSTILFVSAVFLFSKYRRTSIILFSVGIFYAKILTFLPFIAFYIALAIYERNLKNIVSDIIVFLIPISFWLILVSLKYENGSLVDYLFNQFNFITQHKASGINNSDYSFYENFVNTLNDSEFSGWNIYEKIRLILLPLVFIFLIFRNRVKIDKYFGFISIPIISSTLSIYFWFWLLNSTKWIRHTQHFTVLMIFSLVYILNSNAIRKKFDLILINTILILLIDNNKEMILFFVFISILIITILDKSYIKSAAKVILVFFIALDIILANENNVVFENLYQTYVNCEITILSEDCRIIYLGK